MRGVGKYAEEIIEYLLDSEHNIEKDTYTFIQEKKQKEKMLKKKKALARRKMLMQKMKMKKMKSKVKTI